MFSPIWIVDLAEEHSRMLSRANYVSARLSRSAPGSTIYYLEIFPEEAVQAATGKETHSGADAPFPEKLISPAFAISDH